jgi:hypothetical protein
LQALIERFDENHFSATMGRLGATVAGTDPCSTGGHPNFNRKKRRLQMNKFRFTFKILAIAVFMFAFVSIAQAQATRTWVSGVGDDVNPCSRTAPCKTFAGAISKTADAGEIDCLDPGGFGAITITKSMTIDGTTGSGFGSILAAGTNGVNVNDSGSGAPNSKIVILRNLSINGAGTGLIGINITSVARVHVESCQIFGFRAGSGFGINAALTAGSGQKLYVKNTIIEENSGDGIKASNSAGGGSINVLVENTQVNQCNKGVTASTNSRFVILNSSFYHNTVTGVGADSGSFGIDLETCVMTGSTSGLAVVSGTSRIANCRITNNTNGITFAGGAVQSFGDNKVFGNATDQNGGAVTAVPPPAKI